MSSYESLRITRREPDALTGTDGDDYLRLEQAPWLEPPDGGFLEWMIDNDRGLSLESVQEYWSIYKSFCDDEGGLEVEIYVYRSRIDLPYTINASYGELSAGAVGTAARAEYVNIQLADSYEMSVEAEGSFSATWEGDVYSATGTAIPPPTISRSGRTLSWSGEVVGTIKLQYNEVRTVHILTIIPRTGADVDAENPDSAYSSIVRAFSSVGYDELEVEIPDLSGNCGGTNVIVDPEDPDDPDDEQCVRKIILVDPCTLDVISTRTESIACPEE